MNQSTPSSNNNLEIELKFALAHSAKAFFLHFIQAQASTSAQQVSLSNTYYETADKFLRKHDMGLRIRGHDAQYEMTLKTASLGVAGMAKRQEYNVNLPDDTLDIRLLPTDVWPIGTEIEPLQMALKPQFTTDFLRTIWLIDLRSPTGHTQIEVVLDEGQIISQSLSETIMEIEIELKFGAIEDVINFAKKLASIGLLRLSDLSKAARGSLLLKRQLHSEILDNDDLLTPPKEPTAASLQAKATYYLAYLFYLEEALMRDLFDNEKIIVLFKETIFALKSLYPANKLDISSVTDTKSTIDMFFSSAYNTFKINIIERLFIQ